MKTGRKLIIQIPCFNEAGTIGITLRSLPREVEGFDKVEWLIIDDGSADGTIEVAKLHGVDHVVRLPNHQGLAKAFATGLEACIDLGADVIVNTDADNQYHADDIEKLVKPILQGRAEMAVGVRDFDAIRHFSPLKRFLQRFGSRVVGAISKIDIGDAASGFRALSYDAAMRMNIFTRYTYTLESIIQAAHRGIPVATVPIRVNLDLRPSRLAGNSFTYVARSVATIARLLVLYKAFISLVSVGVVSITLGLLIGVRFLYFYAIGEGMGHVQSLILASILLGIGFQTLLVGTVADLLAMNRMFMEDVLYRVKRLTARANAKGKLHGD